MTWSKSVTEKKIKNFVEWITPPRDKKDEVRDLKNRVKENIKNRATEDGLVVRQTPDAGSFSTNTGLRRHKLGNSDVDGQDVDLPFVVSPKDRDGEVLSYLLGKFDGYAKQSYPDTKRARTKSSVELEFESPKVKTDLVPLLDIAGSENQLLIRSDGTRRETNISKHKEFINSRTRSSKDNSDLEFNNMIRLLKWWRCEQQQKSSVEVPSFLINLLCAHAYDNRKLKSSYLETLADWFGYLADVVTNKKKIVFTDFTKGPGPDTDAKWVVVDPVNPANNVVDGMKGYEIEELADWFQTARDRLGDAIVAEELGNEGDVIEALSLVFGPSFQNNHGGEE